MSDWNTVGQPFLYAFEDTLSCPICRELLVRAPKITDCGHTFCSECITRYLTQQGNCPVCRSKTQRGTLRTNKNVEDIAEKWIAETKPQLLKLLAQLGQAPVVPGAEVGAPGAEAGVPGAEAGAPGAEFGAQNGAGGGVPGAGAPGAGVGASTTGAEIKQTPEDQSSCPICHKTMPLNLLQTTHIDRCLQSSPPRAPRSTRSTSVFGQEFPQTKLSLPTLDAMTETKLRSRLKELGVSAKGNKPRLKARYTEWVTIYNAAVDERRPPTVQELRRRMVQWDRAQERGASSLKELDPKQWTVEHRAEYDELVEQARRKRQRRD